MAFTATPKGWTLERFGHYNAATDRHEPFHLYSMRQAIGEGFIHDVLAGDTSVSRGRGNTWLLQRAWLPVESLGWCLPVEGFAGAGC